MTDEVIEFTHHCKGIEHFAMLNDLVEYFIPIDGIWHLWMQDGDCIPMEYCPCCGVKLDKIKEN
ncbi:MAG: hypothetical protein WCS17_03445 [Prevotella sp.]